MDDKQFIDLLRRARQLTVAILTVSIFLCGAVAMYLVDPSLSFMPKVNEEQAVQVVQPTGDTIKDGIHVQTGLKEGADLMLVVRNCTSCHSAKMIIQNRASKEGWKSMIKWMQQTQNLWDLGDNEEKIIEYLATYYPPERKGRRATLKNVDWYELED